jgi:hypothetical protein
MKKWLNDRGQFDEVLVSQEPEKFLRDAARNAHNRGCCCRGCLIARRPTLGPPTGLEEPASTETHTGDNVHPPTQPLQDEQQSLFDIEDSSTKLPSWA